MAALVKEYGGIFVFRILPDRLQGSGSEAAEVGADTHPKITFPVEDKLAQPFPVRRYRQAAEGLVLGGIGPSVFSVGLPLAAVPVCERNRPPFYERGIDILFRSGIAGQPEGIFGHDEVSGFSGEGDEGVVYFLDVHHRVEDRGIHVVELSVPVPVEATFGPDPEGAGVVVAE